MALPGKRIGFRKAPALTGPLMKILESITETTVAFEVEKMCQDPDFAVAFTARVPDPAEQRRYLTETSKYLIQGPKAADHRYVLVFRRTLPSETPKAEEHWTAEYIQARNGLRREIPEGPHRWYSVILCSSLDDIMSDGGLHPEQNEATTDGEVKVISPAYDVSRCVCIIKPEREQQALAEYLETAGAITLDELRGRIARKWGKTTGESEI